MPNWVATQVTLSGDEQSIKEARAQLAAPYQTKHTSYEGETLTWKEADVTGEFLMWNIIRPLNLDAYYQVENIQPASARGVSFEDFVAEFNEKIEKDEDWYHWNIRNWGTKWEINKADVLKESPTEITYGFDTAWSPIEPALNKLAEQYPQLVITAKFIDEGLGFAGIIGWADGKQEFDTDLEVNHATLLEMYGECWICADGEIEEDDPYQCAEYAKAVESLG